jgi:hypothetical protein
MTRPFSSLPLQPTRPGQRRVQRQRANLLGCSLGCLVAGCAERYDIGAFGNTLLQTGDVAPGIGVLLADGIEDADVLLQGVKSPLSSGNNRLAGVIPGGDLDGDGFDDLLVAASESPHSLHILYGGPRPSGRVVRLAQRSSALRLDEKRYFPYFQPWGFPRHGDFDGDGTNDLAIGVGEDLYTYGYELSGKAAAERDAALAGLVQRWTEQPAFLWYGSPERPAQVEFPLDAVAFRARDDLSSQLARVLEQHAPEEIEAQLSVELQLSWLGDVDGDGHGDLALSTSYWVAWGHTGRQRAQCVSYLYYGGARLEVGGEARPPDARLPGFLLAGLGDVNGDGLADVVVVAGDRSTQLDVEELLPQYVFPGSAQRLAGEVSVQDLGVPVQSSSLRSPLGVGDLDGDGIGDLLSWGAYENYLSTDLVYGSPDLLQRPLEATRVSATFAGRVKRAEVYDGGDYDGDGRTDLLLHKTFWNNDGSDDPYPLQPPADQARLIPGSATRYAGVYDLDVIQPSREQRRNELNAASPESAGDFDGDGRSDVVLVNDSDVRIKFGAALQLQVPVQRGVESPVVIR